MAKKFFPARLGRDDRLYFLENLALLIGAGLPVVSALQSMEAAIRSARRRRVIGVISEEISGGSTLAEAIAKVNLLPPALWSLLKIGELTGRLANTLQVIVESEEKERLFRSRIKSAMLYPAIVLSLTVVIGFGIAWFILPRLAEVFASLQVELPTVTRWLIEVGEFLGRYGAVVLPGVAALLLLTAYLVFIFPATKFIGQALLLSFPGVKKLMQEAEVARSGFMLGTLLTAGLPILQALNVLADASSLHRYQRLYRHLHASVEAGNSLAQSFAAWRRVDRLIDVPVQQMIVAGEQSGKLAETLLKISRLFEQKAEATTKNLAILAEPVLLIIVWLGVAAVALAVILPIYNLIGGLRTS
ncbi:MAG: type II secretion system F family protein [Candidatus Magasanikbacteria bacterium]|nr:type II secretion system F family protein [Candidatus Magasanikbacteria bacterium]